ncbi:bifunctional DNA primase/polymerase [Micrococcus luteus]|nr:bifunctional DNA primase/polymerase [Micrococcus luteus]
MSSDLYHLARLLAPHQDRLLGRVAGDLASAGVPVFPCVPGQKRPLTARGFHDATTDLAQIEHWWAQWPDANLGLPTGAASGVVVVDVDVREHVDGRESMRRALDAGRVGMPVFTVVSPSGGRHGYYPVTPGVVQRSWQAARAGVDFRGDGGYIVIPPSHTAAGSYRLATVRQGASAGIDSDALRDFLDPRPALKPRAADRGMVQSEPGVVVARLAAWVAGLGEGERNRGLFWAACRAAEHDIAPAMAVDVLGAAAGEAGLGPREIAATVRSAYRTAHPTTSTASRATEPAAASPVRVPVGAGWGLA